MILENLLIESVKLRPRSTSVLIDGHPSKTILKLLTSTKSALIVQCKIMVHMLDVMDHMLNDTQP